MGLTKLAVVLVCALGPVTVAFAQPLGTVMLNGKSLTTAQVAMVARAQARVEISSSGKERVIAAHNVVLAAADADMPIYGLNRGVGAARQVAVLNQQAASADDPRVRSEQFNRQLLVAHARSTGPSAAPETVRAAMVARLNAALTGGAGLQPAVVQMYADLLNAGITPVLPTLGSVGEADILILSHVGLAMIGMGDVLYRGSVMPAAQALKLAGLKPVVPWGKDGLGILSSNAFSAGMTALLIEDARLLLDRANAVYALSLESLDGNIAPLLDSSIALRPYPGYRLTATKMREMLDGSYLWMPSAKRFSQDPLSFRTAPQLHGVIDELLKRLAEELQIQLNSSDDNPMVVIGAQPALNATAQEQKYFVSRTLNGQEVQGALFPSAHFDPIPWVLDTQALGIALSHLSNLSMQRANRLATTQFTNVDLLQGQPAGSLAGYWKTGNALQALIAADAMPTSLNVVPSARDIEDVGTNAPLVAQRTADIIDLTFRMLGLELTVSADVMDKRLAFDPGLALGGTTRALLSDLQQVRQVDGATRIPGSDLSVAYSLLRCGVATKPPLGIPGASSACR